MKVAPIKKYTKEQLQQFWVGLMDGNGSIQVNHTEKKYLNYRMVIKMKYTKANEWMLKQIKDAVGGRVKQERVKEEVAWILWVLNSIEEMEKTLQILEKYPPLTTRLELQIKFVKECIKHGSVTEYLRTRDRKYDIRSVLCEARLKNVLSLEYKEPLYYNIWLAGFMEAEGSFTYRKTQKLVGYAICQKHDRYLIEYIKQKLEITRSIVREKAQDVWILETTIGSEVKKVLEYFTNIPLLGEKREQLEEAKSRIALKP